MFPAPASKEVGQAANHQPGDEDAADHIAQVMNVENDPRGRHRHGKGQERPAPAGPERHRTEGKAEGNRGMAGGKGLMVVAETEGLQALRVDHRAGSADEKLDQVIGESGKRDREKKVGGGP